MNLELKSHKCETDLVVLSHRRGHRIEIAIGECKDEGGFVTPQDADSLRGAWSQFEDSH